MVVEIMVWYSDLQTKFSLLFKYHTIQGLDKFGPFEYLTSLLFRSVKLILCCFFCLQDPQLMQVWIAIGVGLLIGIVLLFILTRRRLGVVSRRVVLLLGPSDAGKTSVFSQLVHGRSVDTYTSMVENSTTKSFSTESGASKSVQLVDLPGHERLRVAGLEVRDIQFCFWRNWKFLIPSTAGIRKLDMSGFQMVESRSDIK